MTLVVDASVIVAALVDIGESGRWAEEMLLSDHLAAPHLMPAEVSNVLRRLVRAGVVSSDVASLAAADLGSLKMAYFAFEPFADRVWGLRDDVSAYDAWYVALAEDLDASLATLDQRLVRASGPFCRISVPSS